MVRFKIPKPEPNQTKPIPKPVWDKTVITMDKSMYTINGFYHGGNQRLSKVNGA